MNGADTAWIIVATALVLFMTLPICAILWWFMRARNVLGVFMQVYAIACLMSILWLVAGYSIAFGSGTSGNWGGLDKMSRAWMQMPIRYPARGFVLCLPNDICGDHPRADRGCLC